MLNKPPRKISRGVKGLPVCNCPGVSLLWEFKLEWMFWMNLPLHAFLFWDRERDISHVCRLKVGQQQILW